MSPLWTENLYGLRCLCTTRKISYPSVNAPALRCFSQTVRPQATPYAQHTPYKDKKPKASSTAIYTNDVPGESGSLSRHRLKQYGHRKTTAQQSHRQKTWKPVPDSFDTNESSSSMDPFADTDHEVRSYKRILEADWPGFEAALKSGDRVAAWLKFQDIVVDETARKDLKFHHFTALMKLLVEHVPPKPDFIRQVIGIMKQTGISPTTECFNILLDGHSRTGDVAGARTVLSELAAAGQSPDMNTYNLFMTTYIKARNLDAAIAFFDRMVEEGIAPDVTTFNILISGAASANRPELAWKYYEEMNDLAFDPDIRTFTQLIKMHAAAGDMEAAEKWILEMRSRGIDPDAYCYNTLMGGYGRLGRADKVDEIFDTLAQKGLSADTAVYTTIIKAKSTIGDVDGALAVVNEMTKVGVFPDSMTYQTLVSACCSADRTPDAEMLLVEMCRTHTKIYESLYRTIISAYGQKNQLDDATRVFLQMEQDGRWASTETYNIILATAARTFNLEVLQTYWNRLRHGTNEYTKPNANSYATVVDAYVTVNDAEAATRTCEEMLKAGFEPDSNLFVALMECNVRARRWREAARVIAMMRRTANSKDHQLGEAFQNHREDFERLILTVGEEIENSRGTSAISIQRPSQSMEEETRYKCNLVTVLYKELTATDTAPPEYVYRFAMIAHRYQNSLVNVVRVFTELQRAQQKSAVQITAPTITCLLEALRDSGTVKTAQEVVRLIEQDNLPLDQTGYGVLLQLMARHGMVRDMMAVILEMKNAGLELTSEMCGRFLKMVDVGIAETKEDDKLNIARAKRTMTKFLEESFPEVLEDVEKQEQEFRASLIP